MMAKIQGWASQEKDEHVVAAFDELSSESWSVTSAVVYLLEASYEG